MGCQLGEAYFRQLDKALCLGNFVQFVSIVVEHGSSVAFVISLACECVTYTGTWGLTSTTHRAIIVRTWALNDAAALVALPVNFLLVS